MLSREVLPSEPLRPYVRLVWLLELDEAASFGPPERVSPDGLLELIFHYRTPMSCRYDGEAFERQPRSVVVSQTRRFLEFKPEGASGLVSIRFHPWGACHFFRLPVSEIADRQAPAELLWGRAAAELEERLAEAPSAPARVALVERFLLAQLHRHRKPDVEPLVREVWSRRGQVTVSDLGEALGIAERRLERTFAAALGTTPKRFARLCRFLHACRVLRRGQGGTLADLAIACGYYDQSHFCAEFRSFSGMTPGQFARAANVSFLELD